MLPALKTFYEDLDQASVRLVRPTKFVFLCGGILEEGTAAFKSVRDFLIKQRVLEGLGIDYVLAEKANKLYESTHYKDLISFEEDIAKIAAIILVITESLGSLAELGAFASYNPLKQNLRLIVDAKHEADKSFIREGPIRRLQQKNLKHVGFFDWHYDASNYVLADIKKHEVDIAAFIRKHVNSAAVKQRFNDHADLRSFFISLWIIYISQVISHDLLFEYVQGLDKNIAKKDIANKLFCLEIAGWIRRKTYSNKVYFFYYI